MTVIKKYGIEVDLFKEGKTTCPKCYSKGGDRSGDNLMVYGLDSNGHHKGAFCFSCEWTYPSHDWLEENGQIEEMEEDIVGQSFNEEVHLKIKGRTGVDSLGYRGIPTDISKFFGVRYQYDEETGEVDQVLYPCTIDGKISGYKVRRHPKDFGVPGPYGETGKECDLFGQFRFTSFGNTVVIVGGEHDQLAAYKMLKDGQKNQQYDAPAVVSSTVGETAAHKQIQKHYQFFNRFKKIILCFDNDRAGKEAAEKAAKVLPRNKVYIMSMRYKDPNDYLLKEKTSEFISDFWNAKLYTPAGVHASTSLYDAALSYAEQKRLSLPNFLPKATKMFGGGLPKGEMGVIFAKTSVGKSSFVDAMTINWVENDPEEVVGVLSLEATVDKYSTNLFSNYLGVKLTRIENVEERKLFLQSEDVRNRIRDFTENEDGTPRFFVCDDRGAETEVVKEKILEMIIQMGVTILVIDPFSDLMAGMGIDSQEEFVAWLKKVLKEYSHVSLALVCHTRKGKNGDIGSLTEDDIIGTSTIMKSSAWTISLERDKLHENEIMRNVTKVTVHKNRANSETGVADEAYYDWKTGRLYNFEQWKMEHPELFNF